MKLKILALLALLGLQQINAQTIVGSFATNETRLVWTNSVIVNSVQLSATSSGPFILQLFDNSLPITHQTNAAYTNVTSYTTNTVTTFVGVNGITNKFTNTVLVYNNALLAENTNAVLNAIGSWAVSANESLFVPGPFVLTRGVVLKNISSSGGGTNIMGGSFIVNFRSP